MCVAVVFIPRLPRERDSRRAARGRNGRSDYAGTGTENNSIAKKTTVMLITSNVFRGHGRF